MSQAAMEMVLFNDKNLLSAKKVIFVIIYFLDCTALLIFVR